MIRRVLGALVGAEIDRHRGRSGLKGAAVGALAASALRRMGPLGLAVGGAWAAKQAYDRYRAGKAASPRRDPA